MRLPQPRGELSDRLFRQMRGEAAGTRRPVRDAGMADAEAVLGDDDLQISLWALYEQHYRGFDDVDARAEWDPDLLRVRRDLEDTFEPTLRDITSAGIAAAERTTDSFLDQLTEVIENVAGPSLSGYVHRRASEAQFAEFLVQRSIYHLKESDPHAWAIPRLEGAAKVALAELQYDEFGAGRADRLHSDLFARALRGAGLDDTYGAYIDVVPAYTLASNNAMSLFGLHRRLRGASMGHLAAFEATSSLPCRHYSAGADRLGYDQAVRAYFDEHVEADAVHEHLAQTDICATMVDQHPGLRSDVLLGAAACVQLDRVTAEHMIDAWDADEPSLLSTQQAA